jgi:hypothetical protein
MVNPSGRLALGSRNVSCRGRLGKTSVGVPLIGRRRTIPSAIDNDGSFVVDTDALMDSLSVDAVSVPDVAPELVDPQLSVPLAGVSLVDRIDGVLSGVMGSVPGPLQVVVSVLKEDIMTLVTCITLSDVSQVSAVSVLRLAMYSYMLFARPSPLVAIVDYYIWRPVSKLIAPRFSENDFTLRDRLGNGNYGQGGYHMTQSHMYIHIDR